MYCKGWDYQVRWYNGCDTSWCVKKAIEMCESLMLPETQDAHILSNLVL